MEKDNKTTFVAKSITGIMICTFVYKILGFIRELVLSFYFGTSGLSDAYLVSQQIPSVIFDFVGVGIGTCFIPIYFKVLKNQGVEGAFSFTNKIVTLALAFSSVIIGLVLAFAPIIVKAFAFGFEGQTLEYASAFTRICIMSLFFSSYVFVYGSFLQANNVFLPNAFSAVILSICVLFSIVMGAVFNIWIMSIGSCLAVGVRLFFIIPATSKVGLSTRLNFKWRDSNVKEFFILMVPVIIGTSVNEINTLVDRTIASRVAVGAISALTYANSLIQLVFGGVVQPFSTVIFPQITELVHMGEREKAGDVLSRMMTVLLFVLIPITIGSLFFCRPAIELLFSRGAFDEKALMMTSDAFMYYAIGICFIGTREMLSRFFFACEDTKIPMINSSIGLAMNVILNLTLSKYMGIKGLALATSVSSIATTILLWIDMRRRLTVKSFTIDIVEIIKMIIASAIMGGSAFAMYKFVFQETKVGLVVSFLFAIAVYFVSALLINIQSADEAMKIIGKIFGRDEKGKMKA